MTSDPPLDAAHEIWQRKDAWHRAEARRPLREKVRILLALQSQELPLLRRHRTLRPWERPWPIEP